MLYITYILHNLLQLRVPISSNMGQQLPNPGRGESLISICENTVCFLYVGREKLLKQATGNVEEIEFVGVFLFYFFFLFAGRAEVMWPRNVSISYILYYGEIYMLIFHVM